MTTLPKSSLSDFIPLFSSIGYNGRGFFHLKLRKLLLYNNLINYLLKLFPR